MALQPKQYSIPSRYIIISLAALWTIVQLTMLSLFGIGHGGDTERYLRSGRDIATGIIPTGKAASYLSYDLLVGLHTILGTGEIGVVITQLAASVFAVYCMYYIAKSNWNTAAGYIAALSYIAFLKLHPWNVYILTDSMFISAIIITTYLFVKATTTKQLSFIAGTATAALFTTFLRPDGLAIPIALAILGLAYLIKKKSWPLLAIIVMLFAVSALPAWQFIGKLAGHEYLTEHYAKGAVIWSYEPYYLTMPGKLPATITEEAHPLMNLLYLARDKPFYIFQLSGIKILLFLIHIRPYHSLVHNLLIVFSLLILYPTAIYTIRKNFGRYRTISTFLLSLFIIKALIAGATFADWSGRFFLHVVPILLLFASPALALLITRISRTRLKSAYQAERSGFGAKGLAERSFETSSSSTQAKRL